MTIEVSEIAPAFGRPGGGTQARFMRDGQAYSVLEPREMGVLE